MAIFHIFIMPLIIVVIGVIFLGLSPRDRSVIFSAYKSVNYNNTSRNYLISPPSEISENTRIILGFHGFNDSARRFAYYSGLHNAASEHDIVVYPQGIDPQNGEKRGWNAKFCCGSGWINEIDDVGFISYLVQQIREEYQIEDVKVMATGFSNGAFMAQRLAAEAPGLISAVASVAGVIGTEQIQIQPLEPVPIILIHGTADKIIPFAGGLGGSDPDFVWLSYESTVQAWEQINGDSTTVQSNPIQGLAHRWQGWRIANFWNQQPHASKDVMSFFDLITAN